MSFKNLTLKEIEIIENEMDDIKEELLEDLMFKFSKILESLEYDGKYYFKGRVPELNEAVEYAMEYFLWRMR